MQQQELIPHLFRTEFGKIVAVLCKTFGMEHVEAAEDIAGDTFLSAMESWTYKGLPENPTAWLYVVAKNKARNYLKRDQLFSRKITAHLQQQPALEDMDIVDLTSENIRDSQLQMLFAICHPVIPAEAQIGLALRILCGFGIDEIATAFLTNKETINKRLFRAKEKLRNAEIPVEMPQKTEISQRLDTVLTTLYLLFNEGYYSETEDSILREDLCQEAMRLVLLLLENSSTCLPKVKALLALMCFHTSRFAARKDGNGEMILYDDQDISLWNEELISKGAYFLQEASRGQELSSYHLEASIAYWQTVKKDTKEKWENVLQLYNHLLQLKYSPVAALNRTYALSKVQGNTVAINEAEKLKLDNNPFYFCLLGELYKETDQRTATAHFRQALILARTAIDKRIIQRKLDQF